MLPSLPTFKGYYPQQPDELAGVPDQSQGGTNTLSCPTATMLCSGQTQLYSPSQWTDFPLLLEATEQIYRSDLNQTSETCAASSSRQATATSKRQTIITSQLELPDKHREPHTVRCMKTGDRNHLLISVMEGLTHFPPIKYQTLASVISPGTSSS